MISSAIFARYARSLADIAFSAGQEEEVERDLALYRDIFQAVPDLLQAMDSPAIPRDAKERLLKELMVRYPVQQTSGNFLRVLLERNRIRYFKEIYEAFVKISNERKGIVSAQVVTAAPLNDPELHQLRDRLAKATGLSVSLSVSTDADLVGGLVVRIGSTVYDGSIRTQLNEVKRRLSER